MIENKHHHYDRLKDFLSKKFSASSDDTSYTYGGTGEIYQGEPDIPWRSIVFVKEGGLICTHGKVYDATGKADTLKVPVKINGTEFDGSKDITTEKWGNSRKVTIGDGSGNVSSPTLVDGGDDIKLVLPETIDAKVTKDSEGRVIKDTYTTKEESWELKTSIDELEDGKVDKEEGKGLSTNDFTDELKDKLSSIDKDLYGGSVLDTANIVLVSKITSEKISVSPDKLSDYTPDVWDPIGVIVIPTNHDVYGTGECGVMSLKLASITTPDSGQVGGNLIWGTDKKSDGNTLDWIKDLPVRRKVPVYGTTSSQLNPELSGEYSVGLLPVQVSDPSEGMVQCPHDKEAYYRTNGMGDHGYCPSPYLSDGSRNPDYYLTESPTSPENVLSDFSGKSNTDLICSKVVGQNDWKTAPSILSFSGNNGNCCYPAACSCWRYHTTGTSQGDWYLPAFGELGYIPPRLGQIRRSIEMLEEWSGETYSKISSYDSYWTSTNRDSNSTNFLYLGRGLYEPFGVSRQVGMIVCPFTRLSLKSTSRFYTKTETDSLLDGKVDKEEGKGLSTNDFTDELKDKLENLFTQAEIEEEFKDLKDVIKTLLGDETDVNGVIDTFREMEKFLKEISDSDSLVGILQDLRDEIAGKYLPLTGGTLTDKLILSSGRDEKLVLDNTDTEDKWQQIAFAQNGEKYGLLGTFGTSDLMYEKDNEGVANLIWHSGNDGEGSGLDADLLDCRESGLSNGDIPFLVDFPSSQGLVDLGYNDTENKLNTEYYLRGICKWCYDTYKKSGNNLTLIGQVVPNSAGTTIISLYGINSGGANAEGYPNYCSCQYQSISKDGVFILYGFQGGTWYYKTINATSIGKTIEDVGRLKTLTSDYNFNGVVSKDSLDTCTDDGYYLVSGDINSLGVSAYSWLLVKTDTTSPILYRQIYYEISDDSRYSVKYRYYDDTSTTNKWTPWVTCKIDGADLVDASITSSKIAVDQVIKVSVLSPRDLDANALRSFGVYYTPDTELNSSKWSGFAWMNFPVSRPSGAFGLLCLKEGSYRKQIFFGYGSSRIYVRRTTYVSSSTTTWTDWERILYDSDLSEVPSENKIPITDGNKELNIRLKRYSALISQGGWYRFYTSEKGNNFGQGAIFSIYRDYVNTNNESYTFSINIGYGGCINITQLSGFANVREIPKIRVLTCNSNVVYIEFYRSGSSQERITVVGLGKGTYTEPVLSDTIPDGYTATEFETTNGIKNSSGIRALTTKKFELSKAATATDSVDANTDLREGGIIRNYIGPSKWLNAPTGMSTGEIIQLMSDSGTFASQIAWDTTGKMWTRIADSPTTFTPWKQISYSDGDIAQADKLTTKWLTNEDLNTIKQGDHILYNASFTHTCSNVPVGVTGSSFVLRVYGLGASGSHQILASTLGIFERSFNGTWTDWKKIATEDGQVAGITAHQLTNEDLNDIKKENLTFYYSNYSNTCTNIPTGVKGFNLQVSKISNDGYLQILNDLTGKGIYRRAYNGNSSSWSDWKQLAYLDSTVSRSEKVSTKQLTNEDLNTLKDTDISYYFGSSSNTCSGKPSGVSEFGLQIVRTSNTKVTQILTDSSGRIYKRSWDTVNWSSWSKILSSGDMGEGSGLDADLLDGWHRDDVRKRTLGFEKIVGTNQVGGYDLDTLLQNGGMTTQYTSANRWANAPVGMSYGSAICFKAYDYNSLMGMLAWDVNHAQAEGNLTRNLWWRAYATKADSTAGWGQWRQIAFTDGQVDGLTTKQLTNENLNDVKSSGYFVYYGSYNNTCSNKPSSVTSFHLIVYGSVASTSQVLTDLISKKTYRRLYLSESGWSSWVCDGEDHPYSVRKLFTKKDYQDYVVLLWKTGTVGSHWINGKLYTQYGGDSRYQEAEIDLWYSEWIWNGKNYNRGIFRLDTLGVGTRWKLVTCTYNGETWYALQHTNVQAVHAYFAGLYSDIDFTPIHYYSSNPETVVNSEINNSIVDKTSSLSRLSLGDNPYALVSDNVASASKLQTSRNIWGQPFDGTGNVSGNMTGVGSITMNGNLEGVKFTTFIPSVGLDSAQHNVGMQVNGNYFELTRRSLENAYQNIIVRSNLENGNVGIGMTPSSYKLDIDGTLRANGEIISTSSNAFRIVHGNYGAILKMDSSKLYLLFTNSGNQYGNFNDLRPFFVDIATGKVTIPQLTSNEIKIGDCIIKYENGALHFSTGIYSDSFVSARGINSSEGGGGSGFGLLKTWQAPTSDNENDAFSAQVIWNKINSLSLTSSLLTIKKNGDTVCTYDGSVATTANITIGWGDISGKPTTLSGYGITDAYTKTEVDNKDWLKVTSCYKTTEWNDIRASAAATAQRLRAFDVYEAGGPTNYGNVLEITGIISHWQPQLWFDGGTTGNLRHRNKNYNDNTWGDWYTLLDTRNYSSILDGRYVNVTGDTMTGNLSFSTISGTSYPIQSKGLMWDGGTDGARIFYRLTGADAGKLILNMTDDSNTEINFEWSGGSFNGGVAKIPYRFLCDKLLAEDVDATFKSLKIGDCEITWDGTGLKFSKGIYSESFVSAKGVNSTGGASGGSGLIQSVYGWNDLGGTFNNNILNDTFNAYTINQIYTSKLNATKAAIEGLLTGTIQSHNHNYLRVRDVRDAERGPNYFGDYALTAWFNLKGVPQNNYWYSGIHIKGWTGSYAAWELAAGATTSTTDKNLYFRVGINDTWDDWQKILTSSNYSSVLNNIYLPLTGGTLASDSFGTLTIKRNDTVNGASICFRGTDSVYGYIGCNASYKDAGLIRWNSSPSTYYRIWDSGNHGPGSGLNADLLDGYHANPEPSANTIPVTNASGLLLSRGISIYNSHSANLSSIGWYRVFESSFSDATGQTVLLWISRNWGNHNPENYLYAISVNTAYKDGSIPTQITQLSGHATTRIIPKIRIVQKFNSTFYLEIYYNATAVNTVRVCSVGMGSTMNPTLQTSVPDGYTTKEYETFNGSASTFSESLRDPDYHDESHRRTTANINFANDCGLHYFLATSSMSEGKPPADASVIHFEWDNSLSWARQLAVGTNGRVYARSQNGTTWGNWNTLAFLTDNVASASKLNDNTSYKAWGQEFFVNGKPKSVSGDMTGVGNIDMNGNLSGVRFLNFIPSVNVAASEHNVGIQIAGNNLDITRRSLENAFQDYLIQMNLSNRYIGVGKNPSYELDVNGTTRTTKLMIGSITLEEVDGNLHINKGIYSDSFISAKGLNSSEGGSTGGSGFGLMRTWPASPPASTTTDALGANLGWELYKGKLNKYGTDGVLEIARYLDFHTISGGIVGTEDHTVRLDAGAASASRTFTFPTSGGTLATETWASSVLTSALSSYVDRGSNQTIGGTKTFTSMVELRDTSESHAFASLPKLRFHIPGVVYAMLVYDTDGKLHFINGGATDFTANHYPLVVGSIIKSGGTSSQFLMADGSVLGTGSVPYAGKSRLLEEATGLARGDNDSSIEAPSSLPAGIRVRFKNATGAASTYQWNTIVDLTAYSGGSGTGAGYRNQFLFSNNSNLSDGTFWVRNGVDSTWNSWVKVLTSSNYASTLNNTYLTLTGGTLTGELTATKLIVSSGADAKLIFDNTDDETYWSYISFRQNGTEYGKLGTQGSTTLLWNSKTLWHSGHNGHGYGMNSDMLDGLHATAFLQSGDNFVYAGGINTSSTYKAFKIITTWPKSNSSGMPLINIRGYAYDSSETVDIDIVTYIYGGGYMKCSWTNKGSWCPGSIYLAEEDGKVVIYILGLMYYMQFQIFVYRGQNMSRSYMTGWTVNGLSNDVDVSGMQKLTLNSIDSNVTSATQLQTAHTLWGRPFNGTADVTGLLSDVDGIVFSQGKDCSIIGYNNHEIFRDHNNGMVSMNSTGGYLYFGNYNTEGVVFFSGAEPVEGKDYAKGTEKMRITPEGNVGIGKASPQRKLHVNGDQQLDGILWAKGIELTNSAYIDFHYQSSEKDFTTRIMAEADGQIYITGVLRVAGGLYCNSYISARGQNTSSDIRLKEDLREFYMPLQSIAKAPSVSFSWKDGGGEDLGSIAQYWNKVNPLLTPTDNSGNLTLQYGKAALLSAITLAKEHLSLEQEVKVLRKRVEALEKELSQMK